jgi:hypothetical protein
MESLIGIHSTPKKQGHISTSPLLVPIESLFQQLTKFQSSHIFLRHVANITVHRLVDFKHHSCPLPVDESELAGLGLISEGTEALSRSRRRRRWFSWRQHR